MADQWFAVSYGLFFTLLLLLLIIGGTLRCEFSDLALHQLLKQEAHYKFSSMRTRHSKVFLSQHSNLIVFEEEAPPRPRSQTGKCDNKKRSGGIRDNKHLSGGVGARGGVRGCECSGHMSLGVSHTLSVCVGVQVGVGWRDA